jgi:hypothetical protein
VNLKGVLGLALGALAPTLLVAGEDPVRGFADRMLAGLEASPVTCPRTTVEDGWIVTCAESDLKPRRLKAQWGRLIRGGAQATEWLTTVSNWSTHDGQLRREYVYAGTPVVVLADKEGPDLRIAAMDLGRRCGDQDTVAGRPLYRVELDDVSQPERTTALNPKVRAGRRQPGWLTVRVTILQDGTVGGVCALSTHGFSEREQQSILSAYAESEYERARRDGEPVDVVWTLTAHFGFRP